MRKSGTIISMLLLMFDVSCFLLIYSQTDEDSLVYPAPRFTRRKSCNADRRDPKTEEDECIYTDVRDIGSNQQTA